MLRRTQCLCCFVLGIIGRDLDSLLRLNCCSETDMPQKLLVAILYFCLFSKLSTFGWLLGLQQIRHAHRTTTGQDRNGRLENL